MQEPLGRVFSTESRLIRYLQQGRNLEAALVNHYKHDANGVVNELATLLLVHKDNSFHLNNKKLLNFSCIPRFQFPKEQEKQIYKLGLKILTAGERTELLIEKLFADNPDMLQGAVLEALAEQSSLNKVAIFELLDRIKSEECSPDAVLALTHLFRGVTDELERDSITTIVKTIPQRERGHVLASALPLLAKIPQEQLSDEDQKREILRTIKNIPRNERGDVVAYASTLVAEGANGYHIAEMVDAIKEIPSEERKALLTDITSILQRSSDTVKRARFLRLASKLTTAERGTENLSTLAIAYSTVEDAHIRQDILILLDEIPPPLRTKENLLAAIAALRNIPQGFHRLNILNFIELVPEEKRTDRVISAAGELLRELTDGDQRIALLRAFRRVPIRERVEFLTQALPLLMQIEGGGERASLLTVLQTIPSTERRDFVGKVTPLLAQVTDRSQREHLFILIAMLPSADRTETTLATIAQMIRQIPDVNHRISLLYASLGVAAPERAIFLRKCEQLFQLCTNDNERAILSYYLILLDPKDLDVVKTLITPHLGNDAADLPGAIFAGEPVRNHAITYLQQRLERYADAEEHWILCLCLLNPYNQELLELSEEDPLIQQTLLMASISNPEALQNRNNPYAVFKAISQERNNPLSNMSAIISKLPIEIAGMRLHWQGATLLEKGMEWQGYTKKELPPDVSPDTLRELYEGMRQRHDRELSPLERRQRDSDLAATNLAASLEELFTTLLAMPDVENWLLAPQQLSDDEMIPTPTFQLYTILRAALDLSATALAPGSKYTVREKLLLELAATVQNCDQGQAGGILDTYQRLPPEYRLRASNGLVAVEGSAEDKLLARVDVAIQDALETTFTHHPLLSELIGETDVAEGVHQSLFLKNRIAPWVGLKNHLLTFDRHTGVLYDALLYKPLQTLTETFMRHLTPLAIDAVVKASRELFASSGGYTAIISLLEKGETRGDRDYASYLQELIVFGSDDPDDESLEPLQLTDKGAVVLLHAIGYLNTTTKQNEK